MTAGWLRSGHLGADIGTDAQAMVHDYDLSWIAGLGARHVLASGWNASVQVRYQHSRGSTFRISDGLNGTVFVCLGLSYDRTHPQPDSPARDAAGSPAPWAPMLYGSREGKGAKKIQATKATKATRGTTCEMMVTAWEGHRRTKRSRDYVACSGHDMAYAGALVNGSIEWLGGEHLPGVRVNRGNDGSGGTVLESWLPEGTTSVLLTIRVVMHVPGLQPRDRYREAVVLAHDTAPYLSNLLGRSAAMSADDYNALFKVLWLGPEYGEDESEHIYGAWRKWARFSLQNEWGRNRELSFADVSELLASYRAELAGVQAPIRSTAAHAHTWANVAPWERRLWLDYRRRVGMATDAGGNENPAITESVAMSMALRLAVHHMPEGGREVFRALVEDPAFHATAVLGISAYLALWLAPEPVFSKAAAIVTTVGLVATVGVTAAEIIALARAWHRLREESAGARDIGELDAAAARFGRTVGATGAKIRANAAARHRRCRKGG